MLNCTNLSESITLCVSNMFLHYSSLSTKDISSTECPASSAHACMRKACPAASGAGGTTPGPAPSGGDQLHLPDQHLPQLMLMLREETSTGFTTAPVRISARNFLFIFFWIWKARCGNYSVRPYLEGAGLARTVELSLTNTVRVKVKTFS